ncbi:hypothetical protein V1514DRAFT_335625 [Lipomyces japonicus]|uniref:uncharacterized protein n=1 Tax=Lipomyces japonicus TaxID=56871 RepID=UPI0034CDB0FD
MSIISVLAPAIVLEKKRKRSPSRSITIFDSQANNSTTDSEINPVVEIIVWKNWSGSEQDDSACSDQTINDNDDDDDDLITAAREISQTNSRNQQAIKQEIAKASTRQRIWCKTTFIHHVELQIVALLSTNNSSSNSSDQDNQDEQASSRDRAVAMPHAVPDQGNDLCRDIDMSCQFRFCQRPPKAFELSTQNGAAAACNNLLQVNTPPAARTWEESLASTYTSPDQTPNPMPHFNQAFTLCELATDRSVHYPPDQVREPTRRPDQASSRMPIQALTKTLKTQLRVTFQSKNYYDARARVHRTRDHGGHHVVAFPPGKLERGYWRVDVSGWAVNDKLKFWDGIRKTIRAGRAGWVSAIIHSDNHMRGDVVRVYCFGEAVVHIWVMLFIMSFKKTLNGLAWIDGVGKIVITVDDENNTIG